MHSSSALEIEGSKLLQNQHAETLANIKDKLEQKQKEEEEKLR